MKINKNKLYVSDLDGTLLQSNGKLSKKSLSTLNELLEKGLNFTVASARSIISIRKILNGLKIKLPIIEFNGAFITDFESGTHNIINSIDKTIYLEILKLLELKSKIPFISTYNGKKDCLYYNNTTNLGSTWYLNDRKKSKDERLCFINSFYDCSNDDIICITIIDTKESLEKILKNLSLKYSSFLEFHLMENSYSKGWYWLTIHSYKSTKDKAIIKLLNDYNFKLENLVVFGDNLNDIKMLQITKNSVVVNNAKDIVKNMATKIIGSNDDDAVVNYIKNDCIL